MAISDADLWHQVHAQREDGVAAMFLVREVEPRPDQPQIFVIELPYPITEPSKLPDEAGYRRLDTFQEEWIEPACEALGWTFVAWKSEDGSFFLYLYGADDPNPLLEKLAPFDSALGFFHEADADWSEYAALRELVEQAKEADDDDDHGGHVHTDACDHDAGATAHGTSVFDLTAERSPAPARRAAKARAPKPTAAATRAKAPPAKTAPAKAAPARSAAKAPPAKSAAAKATAAKAAPARSAAAKAAPAKFAVAKAAPAKSAATKAAPAKSAAKAAPAKSAAKATKARSSAAKAPAKPARAMKPARPSPAARKPATKKPPPRPAATRSRKPQTSRR